MFRALPCRCCCCCCRAAFFFGAAASPSAASSGAARTPAKVIRQTERNIVFIGFRLQVNRDHHQFAAVSCLTGKFG